MQLIIALETKNEKGSDKLYFKSILDCYYTIRGIKLSYVYMNGKGNYKKGQTKIETYKKRYDGQSNVIFVLDYDNPDLCGDQEELNNEIINYCNNNSYDIAWYNKTVEHVLVGQNVDNKKKTKIAEDFFWKNKISSVSVRKLQDQNTIPQIHYSNILTVLDNYLQRK